MLKLSRSNFQSYLFYKSYSVVYMASLGITTKDPGLSGDVGVGIVTIFAILGITIAIVGSRMYKRKQNVAIQLDVVGIRDGNFYLTGIIDSNDFSGKNLRMLYEVNLANRRGVIMVMSLGQSVAFNIDVTGKFINLNGTRVYSIVSENPGTSMRYYYSELRPFFHHMRLSAAPRAYYVAPMFCLTAAPNRKHWLLLQNKYNLTIYTGYNTDQVLILPTPDNVDVITVSATLPFFNPTITTFSDW